MRYIFFLLLFSLALQQQTVSADFNFYREQCSRSAANGCAAPLVDGPRCLSRKQGECAEYKKDQQCDWQQTSQIGLPEWVCEEVQGECIRYEQVCTEYKKICKAGYKKSCKKIIRPFTEISYELAWLIYQSYMKNAGAGGKPQPIHQSIVKDLQPYFKNDLKKISIARGAPTTRPGITDCQTIYFPDKSTVDALTKGNTIADDNVLRFVLHELRHAGQCSEIGGRKQYAVAWFGNIDIAMKPRHEAIVNDTLKKLSKRGATYLHNIMFKESDAANFVVRQLPIIREATRHGDPTKNSAPAARIGPPRK